MEKVFIAHDPIEAHFVKSLLERAGVTASVAGEALFGLRPEIGNTPDSLPSVWITKDAQLKDARQIISDYERCK
jgi:hypothetical protein